MRKPTSIITNFFLVLVFFLMLAACGTQDSRLVREAKKLYGKQIVLPSEYESLSVSGIPDIADEMYKRYKIVTYIDSSSCSECAFQLVKKWDELLRDIPLHADVGFIPVMYPYDKEEITELLEQFKIEWPLLYDVKNEFIVRNKLNVLARNRTFMLDENNKIIVVGEPLNALPLWEVYKEAMILQE